MTDSATDLIEAQPIRKLPKFGGSVQPFEMPEKPIISTDVKFEPMIGSVPPEPIIRRDLTPPPLSDEELSVENKSSQEKGVQLINDLARQLKALRPEGVRAAANTLSNLLFSARAQKGETGDADEAKRISNERARAFVEDIRSVSPLNPNPLQNTA